MLTLNGMEVEIESVEGFGCEAYITAAYFIENGVSLTEEELGQLEDTYEGIAEEWAFEHNSPFDNVFQD